MATDSTNCDDVVVRAEHVVRRFGTKVAVADVSFTVNRQERFALIGHNGAGKSTLFRMMLSLLPPSAGTITLFGEPVTGRDDATQRAVRRMIGYLPEQVVLYDNLTAEETLRYFAELKGVVVDAHEIAERLDEVGLLRVAKQPVRGFSKGMRQRLGLAQALLGEPKLLFLDEPTTGLDPMGIRDFYQLVDRWQARGTTVIVSSHILAEIELRADRIAILAQGRLVSVGSVFELRQQAALPARLWVQARDASAVATLIASAERLGVTVDERTEMGVWFLWPSEKKERALAWLLEQREHWLDWAWRDATLEEVFFALALKEQTRQAEEEVA